MSLIVFCDQLHADLKIKLSAYPSGLNSTGQFQDFTGSKLSEVLALVFTTLKELRIYIENHPFEDLAAENDFFKSVKPKFTSELLFYSKLHQLISCVPAGSTVREKPFLCVELDKLSAIFVEEQELYAYFKGSLTHMDGIWFSCGNNKCPGEWISELGGINRDWEFSSSQEHKVAAFIAHERLCGIIESRLNVLEPVGAADLSAPKGGVKWTGKIVNLGELIYGLYYTGQINHGNAQISEIVVAFERMFSVKIRDVHHTFGEIRERKVSSPSKFIDSMGVAIQQRVEEDLRYKPPGY